MSYEVSILDCMLNSLIILNPEVWLVLGDNDDPVDSVEDGERWICLEHFGTISDLWWSIW
jgi:hypothetical protein